MDRCPKCGGTSGAYFREWQLWTCLYAWDGEPDGGEQADSKGGRMMFCRDCNSPVMRSTTFYKRTAMAKEAR